MKLSDFDYNLPKELIAQYPSKRRDESRLLVLHRDTGSIEHRVFKDIVEYFRKGDVLVLNDTKVVPARLVGTKETGGRVEVLVLKCQSRDEYEVLLKPARGCRVGTKLIFGNRELKAEVTKIKNGRRFLKFECNGDFESLLDRFGKMPLPSYIKREAEISDRERYQTVYAVKKGAVAAPTAGLHFTKDILSEISKRGIEIEYVTLHVGYGTFKPVKCEDVGQHKMEKEYFEAEDRMVGKVRNKKGRIVAVGTTTCRVLETLFSLKRHCEADEAISRKRLLRSCFGCASQSLAMTTGWTDLFIYPPYRFKAIDALLTNFHLPKTTLLMLVSAFCGRELLLKAYEEAIKKKYRFYSYGDAMLIV